MYLPLRAQPWIYQTDLRYLLCAQSVGNMHIVHGKPIEMKEKWIRKMHRCYSQHDISFYRWSIASFKNFLKIHTRFLPFFFFNNSQIRFPPKNRISKKLRSAIQTSTRMISDRRDRMNSLFLPPSASSKSASQEYRANRVFLPWQSGSTRRIQETSGWRHEFNTWLSPSNNCFAGIIASIVSPRVRHWEREKERERGKERGWCTSRNDSLLNRGENILAIVFTNWGMWVMVIATAGAEKYTRWNTRWTI